MAKQPTVNEYVEKLLDKFGDREEITEWELAEFLADVMNYALANAASRRNIANAGSEE